jgi:hypothetical protein
MIVKIAIVAPMPPASVMAASTKTFFASRHDCQACESAVIVRPRVAPLVGLAANVAELRGLDTHESPALLTHRLRTGMMGDDHAGSC